MHKNQQDAPSLEQSLLDDLLRDLTEQETSTSGFESRFASAQQRIIRRMSPKGREILQRLLLDADSDRLPGLYKFLCHIAMLQALNQYSGPVKVPDGVVTFYLEHDGRPGTLTHLDTCRSCGALVPFLNFFRENRLLRYFETCPSCGRTMK